jgi:hypothetical protein
VAPDKVIQSRAHRDGVATVRRRRGFGAVAFSDEGGGVLQWPTMLIRGLYHETNEGGEAGLVREDEAGRSLELTGRWRNGGGVFGSGGAGRALVAGAGLEDGEAKVGSSHGGGKQRKECSGGG